MKWDMLRPRPRARVIVDNDFAGDPDDLFQLAHHLLSPSVSIPLVSVSGLPVDSQGSHVGAIERGAEVVQDFLRATDLSVPVLRGSSAALTDRQAPSASAAADAIVREAMRTDTEQPLYVALGGGLTELASAYLMEPRIAERLTAIWIGGPEYPNSPYHVQDVLPVEYNLSVDIVAAQVVFGSPIPLWQVPNDAYRQCVVSWAELETRIDAEAALGGALLESLRQFVDHMHGAGVNLGETYVLGDNPLVALTALQGSFWQEPCSSPSVLRPRHGIMDDGTYGSVSSELPAVRVFTQIDTRTMFEDMFAKIARHDRRREV